MRKFFYPKIAIMNLKKNAGTYLPYMLTCIGTIMMFYNLSYLSKNQGLMKVGGGPNLKTLLFLGTIVIGIFSVIFLFYTNSFLIKRRKKEFGLFNILGMEKRHIARVMLYENLITSFISLTLGLLFGILVSKLMTLLLFNILRFDVPLGFEIVPQSIVVSLLLFTAIFFLTLLNNLRHIHLAKPIELLRDSEAGEREPKTKWILTVVGMLCLGYGYYIAQSTKSPLEMLNMFFLAVVLVIVGTYCLFTAGSIAILKALRKNKSYYYNVKHFASVSGMIYRMKQNAAGLANICVLSTMVLVMISSTVSLYLGVDDALATLYPEEMRVESDNAVSDEEAGKLDAVIRSVNEKFGVKESNVLRYRSVNIEALQKGNAFEKASGNFYKQINATNLVFISLDEYNEIEGENVSLKPGELLVYSTREALEGDTIKLSDKEFKVAGRLESSRVAAKYLSLFIKTHIFVTEDIQAVREAADSITGKNAGLSYYYGYDTGVGFDIQKNVADALSEAVAGSGVENAATGAVVRIRMEFYMIYGGLFFLGLFLGAVFIMATVLIMYYKQVSEGYDDKRRFLIMQKVGMSHEEIKKSIHSQVLMVFFLPLGAAIVHIAFAFKVITKMLALLNLTNIMLFFWCTLGVIVVFGIFYAVVYSLTARVYYKIVS